MTVKYVLWTTLTLPLVLLVHPITFVPKGLMDSKVCLLDSFNTAFSPAFPSLPFVTKGLIESKVCPIHTFNVAFSPACPSNHFCP